MLFIRFFFTLVAMINKPNLSFDFPQVDLPNKLMAWHEITGTLLNLYKQACKLRACIFALCVKGSIRASINLIDYTVKEGELITLFPGSIIEFKEELEPVQFCFVGFSSEVTCQINMVDICSTSYLNILEQPIMKLSANVVKYMREYFVVISHVVNDEQLAELNPGIILNQLQSILLGVADIYKKHPYMPTSCSRQEQVYRDLLRLITQHYTKERSAQFYADKIGLTPQHLSTTVKQVTGGTVLNLIEHVVILDAKSKLTSTNLSVQEIAYALNFPTASFFGKYFKRCVGMSPISYKKRIKGVDSLEY